MGHNAKTRNGCATIYVRDFPLELTFEGIAVAGGYENTDQTPPEGKGRFRFTSYEPFLLDSFDSDDADILLTIIIRNLGPVNIVRMASDSWSVELGNMLYGVIIKCDTQCDNLRDTGTGGAESYIESRTRARGQGASAPLCAPGAENRTLRMRGVR